MPFDPGSNLVGLAPARVQCLQDRGRQLHWCAGCEEPCQAVVKVLRRWCANRGDVRDLVEQEAVDTEVTGRALDRILGALVHALGGRVLGKARGSEIGRTLRLTPW